MRDSDLRTLVVVPAWNEEKTIESVVQDLISEGYEVLVVSDGSTDATAMLARHAGARVVDLPINLGVGGALRAGFRYAVEHGFHRAVQCDADGQHLAAEIERLLTVQRTTHAHLVIGSRFAENGQFETSWLRRFAMRVLAFVARRATGKRLTDVSSGFRVFTQPLLGEFARDFPTAYLGDTFEAVVAAGRGGYSVLEVPVQMRQRQHGTSTASTFAAIKFVIRVLLVVLLRIETRIRHWTTTDPKAK